MSFIKDGVQEEYFDQFTTKNWKTFWNGSKRETSNKKNNRDNAVGEQRELIADFSLGWKKLGLTAEYPATPKLYL